MAGITPELKIDLANEAQKAAPPIAVVGTYAAGLTLNDWVMIATLAYIGLQAGFLLWKWWREAQKRR
jgi:hypothetical protein